MRRLIVYVLNFRSSFAIGERWQWICDDWMCCTAFAGNPSTGPPTAGTGSYAVPNPTAVPFPVRNGRWTELSVSSADTTHILYSMTVCPVGKLAVFCSSLVPVTLVTFSVFGAVGVRKGCTCFCGFSFPCFKLTHPHPCVPTTSLYLHFYIYLIVLNISLPYISPYLLLFYRLLSPGVTGLCTYTKILILLLQVFIPTRGSTHSTGSPGWWWSPKTGS
jgi:hypothetical protein